MLIIKIGGGETVNLEGAVQDLATLGQKCVIIHGANALRDRLAADLNIEKKTVTSVSGYTSVFSDEAIIDLMMMAYAGLRNKRLVELCQKHAVNAVGLSGLDGKLIQGRRNQGIRVREGGKLKLLRDFSGKPKSVNRELLELLLANGYVPVLSVPIIDENNVAINSENDDIVNVLQEILQADTIIQLIEAPGFLDVRDDPTSLVARITKQQLKAREQQAEGRMKRKMLALTKLFENGAGTVIIADGRTEHPIRDALDGKGTIIS
jgi:acetylglutamate/LysW-gamma-L-alpha-aminoadipate kinase